MDKGISITEKNGRRVVEGLGYYDPNTVKNLREIVKNSREKYGNASAFKYKDKEGKIAQKTYVQFDQDVDCLGTALLSMELKDTRISVIGENRYEWAVSYFAVTNGTGVVVPLDKHLPQNEIENLVTRGKVEVIFYSPAFQNTMNKIAASNKNIRYFICMESISDSSGLDHRFAELPKLIEKGEKLLQGGDRSFTDAAIDVDQLSILLFTSGTTAMSKGVMLSQKNVCANVSAMSTVIKCGPGDVHLSILPLHHTFENSIGMLYMITSGVCIAYNEGILHIAKNLKEFDCTILVGVPAILEAIFRKVKEGIEKSEKAKLVNTLIKISKVLLKLGIDMRRVFFKSIFAKVGPRLRLAVSGAAPLDPAVVNGFDELGLVLLEGYGLTETSPVVSANNDFVKRAGTIGFPMRGIEVAIDQPDENGMGEIITRGENVMMGYYEDPESTRQVLDEEGWFRTGDLGIIDEKGYTRITGRAKSMIVLDNGKKAFPEEYEVLLNNLPGVKDSFVWGQIGQDGGVTICAKLVLNKEALMEGGKEMPGERELAAKFEGAIKEINKSLPQYKVIRYFVMSLEDLVKTTTLKIKRPVESEKVTSQLKAAGLEVRKASGRFIEKLGG